MKLFEPRITPIYTDKIKMHPHFQDEFSSWRKSRKYPCASVKSVVLSSFLQFELLIARQIKEKSIMRASIFIAILFYLPLATTVSASAFGQHKEDQYLRETLEFPFEMAYAITGIYFDGEKQNPGNILHFAEKGIKKHEIELPDDLLDKAYFYFMPVEPENFDDERLKTWVKVVKESKLPLIGFNFRRCDKVTTEGLSALQELDPFSCIDIDGRNASPQVLALENLPEIKILYFLAAEKTTLDDFRRLARLKKSLKSLSLELRAWPQEDEMDELLDVICKLENVRKLSIRSKPLPLESVRKLKSMSSLKLLTVVTPTMQDGSPCPLDVLQAEFPGVEAWQTDYEDLRAIEE